MAAVRGGRRTGRPPLTERRKAATRLEIAREAVRLFTAQGVAATSAEEIAEAAGVSVRTLWRYFPSKESCVLPLLTAGAEMTARCLRAWSAELGLADVVRGLRRDDILSEEAAIDVPTMMALVRLTEHEPGLRAVWLQAHEAAEPVFAQLVAERSGGSADDLQVKVRAAMINVALRVAIEHYARHGRAQDASEGVHEAMADALLTVSAGLPD
ncbi:TetR/AcrR family transcriptional regulator [Streptomyces sp. NBC_01537]|uniref:TetR/AcrR family transcriptional regulator n=1 Tax=Streptomyces sp. NBC_01537 TaxID=2903896 RepID=UPI00386BB071